MRNLKRALSLALASVMVLGLMIVGSSAAAYSDVDSEDNLEAIEVLKAVGVMIGDDNGNFEPDKIVSRAEMATIMARMMDYTVSSYVGASPFTDVPNSHWASAEIAACYSHGLIKGYGNGKFGPNDNVTTVQAALMMMRALGYFQYDSDQGDNWVLSAIQQGNKIDLFAGVKSAVVDEITRNSVAQLALNTLKASQVTVDESPIVVNGQTIKQAIYGFIGKYNEDGRYAAIRNDIILGGGGGLADKDTRYTAELGEDLFEGKLRWNPDETDNYGRPAVKWSYNTNEIGTYPSKAKLTSTSGVTAGELYNLIGGSNASRLHVPSAPRTKNNNFEVYVDGKPMAAVPADYFIRNSSQGNYSGKGVVTEVYQDADNNVTIVYVNTYVLQATQNYNENAGTLSISKLTGPNTVNALNDDSFDISDYKDGDYILYNYSWETDEITDIRPATLVSGEVSAYSNSTDRNSAGGLIVAGEYSYANPAGKLGGSGYVTIDGTRHDYAKFSEVDSDNGCGVEYSVGVAASIVVDESGFAYWVDDASLAVGNYIYIAAIAPSNSLRSTIVAEAYFTDGTTATITVKSMTSKRGDIDYLDNLDKAGVTSRYDEEVAGWYSFSRDSSDRYTLKKAENQGQTAASLNNKKLNVAFSGTANTNDNTIFIVKDSKDNINVYTGIKTIPDMANINTGNSWWLASKDVKGNMVAAVFVDAGTVKNNTNRLLYIINKSGSYVDQPTQEKVYTYNAILDGEKVTITSTDNLVEKVLYENFSIDSNGFYDFENTDIYGTGKPGTGDDNNDHWHINGFTGVEITQSGQTLIIGGLKATVSSDTVIHLVMYPSGSSKLNDTKDHIMKDENASFETYLNLRASELANYFRGYTVSGDAYYAYSDKNDNDQADYILVLVDSANVKAPATTPAPAVEYEPVILNASTNGNVQIAIYEKNADAFLTASELTDLGLTENDIRISIDGTYRVPSAAGTGHYYDVAKGEQVEFNFADTGAIVILPATAFGESGSNPFLEDGIYDDAFASVSDDTGFMKVHVTGTYTQGNEVTLQIMINGKLFPATATSWKDITP